MIEYIKGNILNVTEGIIVQQVNCMGVMCVGLAKQYGVEIKEYEK